MSEPSPSRLARLDAWLGANARTVTLALFVLSLLPRLAVAAGWAREPVWDGHYYHLGAQRIAGGFGYGDEVAGPEGPVFHPWCHYPVGYSGFLAAFYAIFGDSPRVAVAAQAVVGATTVAVVHRLALRFLGPTRALVAGLLTASHPVLVLYSGLVMTEPLAGLGLLLAPLTFLRLERRPLLAGGAAGVVLGLCTLVRPQSLLCAPALGLLAAGASWRRRAVVGALATAACLSTVLPWTARNCLVMDGCALVSTNGGWNLAIGASPRATGRFEPLRAEDGCRLVTGQVQQDRCWSEQGRAWIAQDPLRWLGLVPKKLSYTFDHQSFAVGYLAQADPQAWPEERRAFWRAAQSAAQWVLLFFAALGLVPRPSIGLRTAGWTFAAALVPVLLLDGLERDPARIWPLAALMPLLALVPPLGRGARGVIEYLAVALGSLVAVHAVFFGEDRYQVVVIPALCLLAAAAARRVAPPTGDTAPARGEREADAPPPATTDGARLVP